MDTFHARELYTDYNGKFYVMCFFLIVIFGRARSSWSCVGFL